MAEKIVKSDEEWRAELSAEEYSVLRSKGTERAFTGEYWETKTQGTYLCRACGEQLFKSDSKFDSGTGWPSFYAPVDGTRVHEERDTSHGMIRTEVTCGSCDSHLDHVFDEGPGPEGQRYCINSVSLKLQEEE